MSKRMENLYKPYTNKETLAIGGSMAVGTAAAAAGLAMLFSVYATVPSVPGDYIISCKKSEATQFIRENPEKSSIPLDAKKIEVCAQGYATQYNKAREDKEGYKWFFYLLAGGLGGVVGKELGKAAVARRRDRGDNGFFDMA